MSSLLSILAACFFPEGLELIPAAAAIHYTHKTNRNPYKPKDRAGFPS